MQAALDLHQSNLCKSGLTQKSEINSVYGQGPVFLYPSLIWFYFPIPTKHLLCCAGHVYVSSLLYLNYKGPFLVYILVFFFNLTNWFLATDCFLL